MTATTVRLPCCPWRIAQGSGHLCALVGQSSADLCVPCSAAWQGGPPTDAAQIPVLARLPAPSLGPPLVSPDTLRSAAPLSPCVHLGRVLDHSGACRSCHPRECGHPAAGPYGPTTERDCLRCPFWEEV